MEEGERYPVEDLHDFRGIQAYLSCGCCIHAHIIIEILTLHWCIILQLLFDGVISVIKIII